MKLRIAMACMIAAAATTPAVAADWFDNVGTYMGRMELWTDGTIWLSTPRANPNPVLIAGHTSSCNTVYIHLLPPAGQEQAWLDVLISAKTSGKGISVFGECAPNNARIDATRLVVDY